jgi:hypothetical protein
MDPPAARCATSRDDDALGVALAAATQRLPLCAAKLPTQPGRHNLHVATQRRHPASAIDIIEWR